MDFWSAYRTLRKKHRAEEIAVGIDASVFTVLAWDMTANGSKDVDHVRNPGKANRLRLSRFAAQSGQPARVVDALLPDSPVEARQ